MFRAGKVKRVRLMAKAALVGIVWTAAVPTITSSATRETGIHATRVASAPEVGMARARLRVEALKPQNRGPDEATVMELQKFLKSHGSPMAPHAADIVAAAARYEVDHRLVVAIAGVESTFGRHCRGFNAWGWNNGATKWASWPASIDSYTKAFARGYPDRADIKRFARRYNPNTPQQWASKVSYFMAAIDRAGG